MVVRQPAFCRLLPYRITLIIIVIPCFNEADRLAAGPFLSFLAEHREIELLFVDDGSSDSTAARICDMENRANGRVSLLRLPKNQGKAEAVRQGVLHSLQKPAHHIAYWDADLATPLGAIIEFTEFTTAAYGKKMICGARVQRLGADIKRHWYRHYPGRIIAACISIILGLPLYDSQCGAKLIERDLAEQIFAEPFLSPWLFDVELIARVIGLVGRKKAAQIIYELPLSHWTDVGNSKISLAYLPRIPFELIRIYRHYRHQLHR